jgi:putative transposase
MSIIIAGYQLVRALFRSQLQLAAENLAMRQQLAILVRKAPRPKLLWRDRIFWLATRRLFASWATWLVIVKPDTVVRWHCTGFRLFWRWKSRGKPGRPPISRKVIALIQQMARENVTWGAPRIQAELHLLGHDIAQATVAKYMPRSWKPPSPTWKTFLRNHAGSLVSIDFFVVPTATFRLLYGFLILAHERRRILHFNGTAQPSAAWVCRQFREAFPFDSAPEYLIRDRDGTYGQAVSRCLEALGIEEVLTAPQSPWQNPYCERLIGTLRRELLDHVIVVCEDHLKKLLREFITYYHSSRTHRSLEQNAPDPRVVEMPHQGEVIALPYVGGLHHRYARAA